MSHLQIEKLSFSHRASVALLLEDINLTLKRGEIGALLGASGSGKTTLLRCIAGFLTPSGGTIRLENSQLFDQAAKKDLSVHQRQIGFLFQHLALFPHMTVQENITYGLHRHSAQEKKFILNEMLTLIGLEAHAEKYPQALSGGEKQRVALARALAPRPQLLLMDEPFSSLDQQMRLHLREEIKKILKSLQMTALIVTHDYDDAHEMADRVGLLQGGRLKRWAPPADFFDYVHRPVPHLK